MNSIKTSRTRLMASCLAASFILALGACDDHSGRTGSGLNAGHGSGLAGLGQGPAPLELGLAGEFAILAKSASSSIPTSAVTGNIGLSPSAASFITGYSLV